MFARLVLTAIVLAGVGCAEKPWGKPYGPWPTTRPITIPADPNKQVGTYGVSGHVMRPGEYPLTGQPTTLKDALKLAGFLDAVVIELYITISRQNGGLRETILKNAPASELYGGFQSDVMLQAGDEIFVSSQRK